MTTIHTDELLRLTLQRARELFCPPVSTYRLQFHAGFTFKDATEIVPYLAELGITHVYASPYLAAVAGSMHGYDVIDHSQLNPEVGSEEDYQQFLAALQRHGMSHILDTVPNHMGVETNDNRWWNSVLELGRNSPFADYFDISWDDSGNSDLSGRVLVPTLGEPYGEALAKGQIKVGFERISERFLIEYFQRHFPIDPSTSRRVRFNQPPVSDGPVAQAVAAFNGEPGDPRAVDRLDRLLLQQHYRLAWWRVASEEINYRRFFDINGLAALKIEREAVFSAVHEFTLRLAAEGKIAGLRIDHPDGLYDPAQYFRRLQKHYLLAIARQIVRERLSGVSFDLQAMETAIDRQIEQQHASLSSEALFYVVAEKILAFDESLPDDWPCHGTSGYDFLVMVNALFVDRAQEERFTQIYQSITGSTGTFTDIAYRKKILVLSQSFASEMRRLTGLLHKLAEKSRRGRDFTFQALHDGLREIIACFPVYRTYIDSPNVRETDRAALHAATANAIERNRAMLPDLLLFIRDLLLQKSDDSFDDEDKREQLTFAGRFQQLTTPATAKGVEDTAFYVYHRLISLNEVGGDPSRFGIDPYVLHGYLSTRQRLWPYALNPLSTHDTKRSEDVRARLNVLSEIPDEWEAHVTRWIALNAPHRRLVDKTTAPAIDEEYLLYQTLVGIWPFDFTAEELPEFEQRVQQFMQKALREAKLRTSWTQPGERWEAAMREFIANVLSPNRSAEFIEAVNTLVRRITRPGLLNSLAQTLIRIAAPGVPDTYQGTELWDFSLVDPDNRRPVDYSLRFRLLEELRGIERLAASHRAAEVRTLWEQMEDGRIKLWMTRQALRCRRVHPNLFGIGQYLPVAAIGSQSKHVFAFARLHESQCALCIVPLRTAQWFSTGPFPAPGTAIWADTQLNLPERFKNAPLENVLTGERFTCNAATDGVVLLPLSQVFGTLPVALIVRSSCSEF